PWSGGWSTARPGGARRSDASRPAPDRIQSVVHAHPSRNMPPMLKDGAKTVASALVELIRRDSIAGSLPPGSRLPIKALSERYGAGPIPIREALARLSAVGLVTAHEQRGFW